MKNYCEYNAGLTGISAREHADTIEPDPIMVGEYDWESAPDGLKEKFTHLIGAYEEETE